MPENRELLEVLTDALEEHKEKCYFGLDAYSMDDIYDEWEEYEIESEIEDQLIGENFAVINDKLYSYGDDIKELLEYLSLDENYNGYELLDYDQAVQFLLDHDIELTY